MKGEITLINLGQIDNKIFYLKQDPLTMEITLQVNYGGTNKQRIYKSKKQIMYYLNLLLK